MSKQNLAIYSPSDLLRVPKELQLLNVRQLDVILMPTPPTQIKSRQGKGGQIWRYVNGAYCTKMLNLTFGFDWDFKVLKHEFDLNIGQAFVLGELTIRIGDKAITKQQFGRSEIKFLNDWILDPKTNLKVKTKTQKPVDIGNDLKGASTDAMKKCATAFGFFSDVYHAEDFKEVLIVSDEDKEAKKAEQKLKIIKQHLESCKSIEDIDAVQLSLENNRNGELSDDEFNLITEYKNKINDVKKTK